MLRRVLLVLMATVVSYSLTSFGGYILYTLSEGRSETRLSLAVRLLFNPVIALVVGCLVGFLSKDRPALTSIVGLAPWALMLLGLGRGRPLTGWLEWIGPILAYVALGTIAAVLAWRLRHARDVCKSANMSTSVTPG